MGIAFAGALPDSEDHPSHLIEAALPETTLLVRDALSQLSEREALILSYYYLEEQSPQEIAERLELTVSNVTKIRQRAIIKLRKRLDIIKKGERDEEKRSGI